MKFVSRSQNFEDVMLWRALKDVKNGFYIDVGALYSELGSITLSFYERGWSGINIEPNPKFCMELDRLRARDVNLNIAIGDNPGYMEMYFMDDPGLSTADVNIARNNVQDGWEIEKQEKVAVKTLAQVCREYINEHQSIHFLKIDVEGYEKQVIKSNEWLTFRPWIVLVEATLPWSQVECYEEWESILTENNYIFCYADGLNRFYVAKEHSELAKAFRYPPNVFDDFVLSSQVAAEKRAQQAEQKAQQAEQKAQQAEQKAQQAEQKAQHEEQKVIQANCKLQEVELTLHAICNSRSWRVTFPLRWAALQSRNLFKYSTIKNGKHFIRRCVYLILKKVIALIDSKPWIRIQAIKIAKNTGVYRRARSLYQYIKSIERRGPSLHCPLPSSSEALTPYAREVYAEIKVVMDRNRK